MNIPILTPFYIYSIQTFAFDLLLDIASKILFSISTITKGESDKAATITQAFVGNGIVLNTMAIGSIDTTDTCNIKHTINENTILIFPKKPISKSECSLLTLNA